MTVYEVLPLTDPAPIRAFLGDDPGLTAYAVGDLDPALWPQSEFVGAFAGGELAAVVLFYHGLDPVIITAFGAADGVRAVLDNVALPREMYALMPEPLGPVLWEYFDLHSPHDEWRMVLDLAAFTVPDLSAVTPILPEHADQLAALYQSAASPGETIVAFSPAQIAHGVFYGVWQDRRLIATAGTHIWSPAESVVAIGNVFTAPDERRRGYGTQCTAAVVADALAAGIQTVVLNVRCANTPAIRIYEKLGFARYARFLEGPGLRKAVNS